MKKFLVITGVALSLVASSAFANSRAQQAAEAATKVKDRVTGTKVQTTGSKIESRANLKNEARGSKTVSVEEAAAEVQRAEMEAAQAGAQCDKENLSATKLGEQGILKEATDIGLIKDENCFVAGSITDDVARGNGLGTVQDGTTEAKRQGATARLKAFALGARQKAQIAGAMFASFVKRTGRNLKDAVAKKDFKDVCVQCFGPSDAAFCSIP